jgi:phage antirepressor YoqD-like protein
MLKSLGSVFSLNIIGSYEEEKQVLLSGKEETVQFWLNKKLCDTLISGYSIPIRYAIIEEFDKLQNNQNQPSYQIEDPIARAKRWIEEAELAQKALQEVKIKEQLLEEAKPHIERSERFLSHNKEFSIGDFAKTYNKIGRNSLFKFLRDKKVLMKDNNPYQTYIDRGYFKVIQAVNTQGVFSKTLVTVKGFDWLTSFLDKELIDS